MSRGIDIQGKRMDTFALLLGMALVLLTCWTVRDRFNDSDLWWHLRTGQLIAQTHAVALTDSFSFSAPSARWVRQEWLSELSIFAAYRFGGNTGLALWLAVVASSLLIANYLSALYYCGNSKIAFLGGMLVWLFATVGLAIRPHLLGYLLLTLELLVLEAGFRRHARWFLALPVLFLFWVNLHGSFFLGLVVLAAFVATSFFHGYLGWVEFRSWDSRQRKLLILGSLLSFAALFANPVGLELLRFPLDVIFNQPINARAVIEWRPTVLFSIRGIGLIVTAAILISIPLVLRKRMLAHEAAFFLLGLWLAVRHERLLFVFAILVAPTLCRLLANLCQARRPMPKQHARINVIAAAAVALMIAGLFPDASKIQKQIDESNPWEALLFVRKNGLAGRMLNDYNFGGFLIWAAPERKVFIDGRGDMYEPVGVLADYENWIHLRSAQKLLDKYQIDYCVMGREATVARILAKTPGWKEVYSDHKAVVIVRQKMIS